MSAARLNLICFLVVLGLGGLAFRLWPRSATPAMAARARPTPVNAAMARPDRAVEQRRTPMEFQAGAALRNDSAGRKDVTIRNDVRRAGAEAASRTGTNSRVESTRLKMPDSAPGSRAWPARTPADARLIADAQVQRYYGPFFERLEGRGVETTEWRRVLLERQTAALDGSNWSFSEIDRWLRNLKAAVGEVAYDEFITYDFARPERNLAADLERRLADSASPLSVEQREQFIVGLHRIRSDPSYGPWLDPTRMDREPPYGLPDRLIPPAALGSMRALLAPEQMEKLEEIFREQQQSLQTGVHRSAPPPRVGKRS